MLSPSLIGRLELEWCFLSATTWCLCVGEEWTWEVFLDFSGACLSGAFFFLPNILGIFSALTRKLREEKVLGKSHWTFSDNKFPYHTVYVLDLTNKAYHKLAYFLAKTNFLAGEHCCSSLRSNFLAIENATVQNCLKPRALIMLFLLTVQILWLIIIIMPKRYHCDYCNKSFQDTPRNRKKHLSGAFHQRMRKYHYDSISNEDCFGGVVFKCNYDFCGVYMCSLIAREHQHQSTSRILYSGLTGKEILEQWIATHPNVQRRYQKLKSSLKK